MVIGGRRQGAALAALYDGLHLAAARKASAESLITPDLRDFQSIARPGDPRIEMP